VIGKIGEWVADRRQFPIENTDHPGLGLVEDEIVHAIIAVHDARLAFRRQMV